MCGTFDQNSEEGAGVLVAPAPTIIGASGPHPMHLSCSMGGG